MNMISRIALKIAKEYWKNNQNLYFAMSPARLTKEQFIERSIAVWGQGKFDYQQVQYQNQKNKVHIKCIIHNHWFWQTPNDHWNGKKGCWYCQQRSKGQQEFQQKLKQNNIIFIPHHLFHTDVETKKYIKEKYNFDISHTHYDFYIEHGNEKFLVQIQGEQHWDEKVLSHLSRGRQTIEQRRLIDQGKREFAQMNNYVILQIPNISRKNTNIPQDIKKHYCNTADEAIAIILQASV